MLAVAFAGCGEDDEAGEGAPAEQTPSTQPAAPEPPEPMTVELREVNGSGQSGTATVTAAAVGDIEAYDVLIELGPAVAAGQMAHVHTTTCAEYAAITDFNAQLATVQSPLTDVRDGASQTHNVSASITAGGKSINVHEPAHPFPAVACGDIPGTEE